VGKAFFSEEKKEETFMSPSRASSAACALITKVFWFFFSKKNCLPSLPYDGATLQEALAHRQCWRNDSANIEPADALETATVWRFVW
jgi:hypothetical protein